MNRHPVKMGSTHLTMLTYGSPERPMALVGSYGEAYDFYWYTGYRDLPFDPKLFAKLESMKVDEVSSAKSAN